MLLVYQPAAWPAPAGPAVVGEIATKGIAEINGANAVTGASVFSGDRIVSHSNSTATLALKGGSRVVLVGAGAVQIKASEGYLTARLEQGKAAFLSNASAPIVVEAGGTRTVAGKKGGVFLVALNGNQLEVTAHQGDAEVEAGNRTVEVAEGKTLRATLDPSPGAPNSGGGSNFAIIALGTSLALSGSALGLALANLSTGCKTVSPSTVGCEID